MGSLIERQSWKKTSIDRADENKKENGRSILDRILCH